MDRLDALERVGETEARPWRKSFIVRVGVFNSTGWRARVGIFGKLKDIAGIKPQSPLNEDIDDSSCSSINFFINNKSNKWSNY